MDDFGVEDYIFLGLIITVTYAATCMAGYKLYLLVVMVGSSCGG
jgi:hypothetical protein